MGAAASTAKHTRLPPGKPVAGRAPSQTTTRITRCSSASCARGRSLLTGMRRISKSAWAWASRRRAKRPLVQPRRRPPPACPRAKRRQGSQSPARSAMIRQHLRQKPRWKKPRIPPQRRRRRRKSKRLQRRSQHQDQTLVCSTTSTFPCVFADSPNRTTTWKRRMQTLTLMPTATAMATATATATVMAMAMAMAQKKSSLIWTRLTRFLMTRTMMMIRSSTQRSSRSAQMRLSQRGRRQMR